MARKVIFFFNLAREEFYSVNLARLLKKFPTPGLDDTQNLLQFKFAYKDRLNETRAIIFGKTFIIKVIKLQRRYFE